MPHSSTNMQSAALSSDAINALPLPRVDLADTTATTGRLSVGTSVYGTVDANSDRDWYAVTLTAGSSYEFRLMGVGRDPVTDTYFSLRNAAGTVLRSNDDFGGDFGNNSIFTFSPNTTGTYYVDAGGFSSQTGDFLLTAVELTGASGRVFTAEEVAWQLTNNFERYFETSGSSNVPATAYDLSGGRTVTYNVALLTAAGKALAVQALRMWSDVTGINFVQTTGAAQISFDDSEAGLNAYNNNVTEADGTITSSSLMVTTDWLTEFGNTLDSYSFETIVHELGHALGLGHGGNYNGSATYGIDNYYVNDSQHLSIMSYMQSQHDEFSRDGTDFNTFTNAQFRWVLTPMIADILAMSNLYGLSTTTRTGNTTYGYNSNTGNAALDQAVTLNNPADDSYVAFTIFDNGGTDTVDMSGFAGAQRIDLQQGASSDVLGGLLNMGIAYGTVVENAYGGGGSDSITGNSTNNLLKGAGGSDSLFGGAGNDTLDGGALADFAFGGAGNDVFLISGATIADEIYGGIGIDTLDLRSFTGGGVQVNLSAERYGRVAGGVQLVLRAIENVLATAQNDTVTGSTAANILNGLAGRDLLDGGVGNDTINGGAGIDTLKGGLGADVMFGGDDSDIYYVDNRLDLIAEVTGGGIADRVLASTTFTLAADDNIEILSTSLAIGLSNIKLAGNALAQSITGNEGNNLLNGLGGNDTLSGGGGSDTLIGSTGQDVLLGGAEADFFVFNVAAGAANSDRIVSYNVAEDTIQLHHNLFTGLVAGATLSAFNFAANLTGAAVRTTDRIIYETDTGKLYFDADGVGGAAGLEFASITPNLAGFGANEFAII